RSIPDHLEEPEHAADALRANLDSSQAAFGLLLHQDQPFAHAGDLSPAQLRELSAAVPKLGGENNRGAVTRYVRLPDRSADDLLYAAPIAEGLGLALVFAADVAFRTAREETRRIAADLLGDEEETADGEGTPTSTTSEAEPQEPSSSLPTDWVPESDLSPAQHSMLEEWADLEPPRADPPEGSSPPAGSQRREELPNDWVPRERPPDSRLDFAEQRLSTSAPAEQEHAGGDLPGDKMQEAAYHLPFTAVLIPRFPEHQLTGALARQVREWTQRLCVAWDWRAEEIHVEPNALRLRVSLIPESAPAEAVERLREDLSRRILDRYPQFKQDLPSERFWARGYLLTAGDPPDQDRIERFIAHTRRAQGFEV
ncbi:MAG: transposase, partial [Anaerolineales bacterium]|nr:transposase [Anaerolineales bacterium]